MRSPGYRAAITLSGLLMIPAFSPSALAQTRVGDCNGDGVVTIEEATLCVTSPPSSCPACDANGDQHISLDEQQQAELNATIDACGRKPGVCASTPMGSGRAAALQGGDCNGDGIVSVQEAGLCARIAFGETGLFSCGSCDADRNGEVSASEVTMAQQNAVADACADVGLACAAVPTATATSAFNPSPTPSPSSTPSGTETDTPTSVPSNTPTPTPIACVGDCDGGGAVTVNELLIMVNIALDNADVSTCRAGDADGDGTITINEILTAVNNALGMCPEG